MLKRLIFVTIFISLFNGYALSNSCEKQMTCSDCIRDPSHCVWCAHNNFTGTRCKLQNDYSSGWCPEEPQNPFNSSTIPEHHNREFSSDSGSVIQIKPQKYKLKVRVGEPITFSFSFKGAKDYPVDLYFLLDASRDMQPVKSTAAKQSENIYKAMKEMTSDVYLGMGSFIDKNALPFCKSTSENTYSFRHRLKLTTSFSDFKETISNMPFGINRDPPEGGLDALAQVIVCKDTVGWRNESRKIVVFLSDAPYHAAGDGKAAGIIQPYDGGCYTENNVYTKELEMDYPSVSMISKLAAEHDVIVLFVIDDKYVYVYHELSRIISGSKAESFDKSSISDDKLVNILRDIYQKITKTVKLKVNVKDGHRKNIKVSFDPDCTQPNNNKCATKSEEEQKFTGTLKVLEYDAIDNYTVEVAIEGISEKLTLDVEVIKNCECENSFQRTDICNGEIQECGICKCGDKRYGDKCACVRNEQNKYNDNFTCIAEGTNEICSGRGSCVCGTCKCNIGYEGKYCQCNHDSCTRDVNENFCSGNGRCVCGKCDCHDGWIGDECQCSLSNETCKGPNGKMCNGRGECSCGRCQCPNLPKWDSRYDRQDMFCGILPCPQCKSFQCRILETCALSLWGHHECRDHRIRPRWTKEFTEEHVNGSVWNLCPDFKVGFGCYARFVYKYDDEDYGIDILVLESKDCIENYSLYGGITLLVIIIIGIATLIGWKLLTEARDRREYKSFVERHKEDLSEPYDNPLYAPATTTFSNPAFRKGSIVVK